MVLLSATAATHALLFCNWNICFEWTNSSRPVSSVTSEGDLRQLRKELEKDFKRAMAANLAKQQKILQGDKVREFLKWAPH